MFFIKSIVDDKCLVVDTKDGVEEWFYTKDILKLDIFVLGKKDGKLRAVGLEEVINYQVMLLKLAGITIGTIEIEGSCLKSVNRDLKSFEIPYGITSIGDSCFMRCVNLEKIIIPDSVTSIEDYCFSGCGSLKSIEIPNSVTSIGDYCFSYCESLKSIKISDSVTSLGYRCFRDCVSLESIIIPDSVTRISSRCFEGCISLKEIYLHKQSLINSKVPQGCKVYY